MLHDSLRIHDGTHRMTGKSLTLPYELDVSIYFGSSKEWSRDLSRPSEEGLPHKTAPAQEMA
jgi:hypothetical protein